MSREVLSVIRGAGVGIAVGFGFGLATLSTIGFDRMTFYQGLLLVSCSMFGGVLFGALIGSTGAFRKDAVEVPAEKAKQAVA